MSVKVKDFTPKVRLDINRGATNFIRKVVLDVYAESLDRTPMKTGELRSNVLKQAIGNSGAVVWKQPYAIYQEDKQHKNYATPGTGPHFARNAVAKIVANTGVIAKRVL